MLPSKLAKKLTLHLLKKLCPGLVLLILVLGLAIPGWARVTVYTDRAAFSAAATGLTNIDFTGSAPSGGQTSYSTEDGLVVNGVRFVGWNSWPPCQFYPFWDLQASDSTYGAPMLFDWGSGVTLCGSPTGAILVTLPVNVTAVGADVMSVNVSTTESGYPVVATLSGGQAFCATTFKRPEHGFVGFTSSTPISTIRFNQVGASAHTFVDNFVFGQATALPQTGSITGYVVLADFIGDVTSVPVTIVLIQNDSVVRRDTVTLGSNGSYMLTEVDPGTYAVMIEARHWLRRSVSDVVVSGGSQTTCTVALPNGDCDRNGMINTNDVTTWNTAFGSRPGDSNWNPDADLDGSLEVDLGDYAIIDTNMGLGSPFVAAGTTLVNAGRTFYTIVLSDSASVSEKYAAQELSKFIRQMSGASLPISTESANINIQGPKLLLGDGNTLESLGVSIDFDGLGEDGFVIKTVGRDLVIAGSRLRGTLNGVYGFLEDVLGCHWYTPYVSHIPQQSTIALGPLDILQKPSFERRHVMYDSASNQVWAARNRENGSAKDAVHGGYFQYGGPKFVHTFYNIIPPETYASTHPEYFSLINNARVTDGAQLCLTNPSVLAIAKQTVHQWIDDNPECRIFSVSQNDSVAGNCQCANCLAKDNQYGGPSGTLIWFVNQIASEVAATHPNAWIDTLAYHYTEQPPTGIQPNPNVIVRMCPINQCQYHPYNTCGENAAFMSRLTDWSGICDNLYIWHYSTDFSAYLIPYPDLDQLVTSIAMYKNLGVKGLMTQGTTGAGGGPAGSGGFMDDLKAYLIAKLMWNADADAAAIKTDFLSGYFGDAGEPIGEFLDLLQTKVSPQTIHGRTYEGVGAPTAITGTSLSYRQTYMPSWTWGLCDNLVLTSDIMAQSDQLFDEAEALAGNQQ